MCGIVGYVGTPERATLIRMRDSLRHRGPDEGGEYLDAEEGVALGHRRLSIIDLSHGQQPMFSPDGQMVLVFNGEIYNHSKLRARLEGLGHRYETNCDTESILHAYSEWGTDCVEELDGMFAFVIYDKRKREFFGARDRFGKKPFYYMAPEGSKAAHGSVRFAFASELKALRVHPELRTEMQFSMESVISYLLNDYVLGERSIYDNVRRLPPGGAFTFNFNGGSAPAFRQWRYWEPQLCGKSNPDQPVPSFDDAADQLLELFEQSVQMRLMSDVPLGAFISGGIDSTAIVAMMTRLMPPSQVKTFCIGFQEASFDESFFAQMVADHYHTDHYARQFTASDMLHELPDIIRMMDEPYADPSILPVTLLSKFAREHVTVALGGDGGDELFAGYDPFRAVRPAQLCRRILPEIVRRGLVEPAVGLLPASDQNMSLKLKLSRFLRGVAVPQGLQTPVWMGAFSLPQLKRLLPDHCSNTTYEQAYPEALDAHDRLMAAYGTDPMISAIDFFQRFYLADDILVKVDRASMAHSLEVRCPMLDRSMAEFANRLPTSYKISGPQSKRLLKHMVTKPGGLDLPRAIVNRRKKGFGIPVGQWIRRELREDFERTLLHEWPTSLAMFNADYIAELHATHMNRSADNYKELWTLFILARWAERDESPVSPQAAVAVSVGHSVESIDESR